MTSPRAQSGHEVYNEFFQNQENFFTDMQKLNDSFNAMRATLSSMVLTRDEMLVLENYLKPFESLTENPYPRVAQFEALSIPEKINLIEAQMLSPNAIKFNTAVLKIDINGQEGLNFMAAIQEKMHLSDSEVIKSHLANFTTSHLIKPVQHIPRFVLTVTEMQKSLSKASLSEVDKHLASVKLAKLQSHFAQQGQKLNETQRERELAKVADALQTYSGRHKKLHELSKSAMLESDINTRFKLISKAYLQAYTQERRQSRIGFITKSPYLKEFESILTNAIDKYSSKPKADAFIFHNFPLSNEITKDLVLDLFSEAQHSIHRQQQQVYVNSIKAVMRMGQGAIAEWNALAKASALIYSDKMIIDQSKLPTDTIRKNFASIYALSVGKTPNSPVSATRLNQSPPTSPRGSFDLRRAASAGGLTPTAVDNSNTSHLTLAPSATPLIPSRTDKGLLANAKIDKIQLLVESAGWTLSAVKTIQNEGVRKVAKTDGGMVKQFSITSREMKTHDTDVETFVMMLKSFEQAHHKLPTITTANSNLKSIWMVACAEVYPGKMLDFDKMIVVKNAIVSLPQLDAVEPSNRPTFRR